MPKVSVIIPVYGVEKYIARCARSLFRQTIDDIEFIFIDDCSPDDSIKILQEVLLDFPNRKEQVIIHRMEHNSGQAAVREWGMKNAKGDYVIHCDSDDWVDERIYATLYNEAVANDYDIVSCDYYRSCDNKHTKISIKEKVRLQQGPLWNKLVKRSLYVENAIIYPKANKAEDGALMTQLSFYAKKTKHLPIPLYYYFYNPNSICVDNSGEKCMRRLAQEVENVELRIRFLKEHNALDEYGIEVMRWKYIAKNNLLPVISEKEYYDVWKSTYPEITTGFLLSNSFRLRTKINFLLRYFRIKKS